MNVEQIERGIAGDLGHFYRQGKSIGRMIKQRIAGDFYFMKINALVSGIKPDGRRVADEMNFMATRGQFNSQLGSDYARSSVSGIASDSNFHGCMAPDTYERATVEEKPARLSCCTRLTEAPFVADESVASIEGITMLVRTMRRESAPL